MLVFVLMNACGVRHERQNMLGGQFAGMNPQPGEERREFGRMHRAGQHRPRLVERLVRALIMIGNADAANRFGGMRRPPADHVGVQAALRQDVPDRLDFAGR